MAKYETKSSSAREPGAVGSGQPQGQGKEWSVYPNSCFLEKDWRPPRVDVQKKPAARSPETGG